MDVLENAWENENWSAYRERYNKKEIFTDSNQYVEILPSRSGLPTIRIKTEASGLVFLHSSVDPVKEAARIAAGMEAKAGTAIIVYGLGLGYLAEALLERFEEKVSLFIIEPDRAVFCQAMRNRDLRHVLCSDRVYIQVGGAIREIWDKFFIFYDTARYTGVVMAGLPGYQTVYGEHHLEVIRTVKAIVDSKLFNLVTMTHYGPNMISNAILNLWDYYKHPGVRTLYGKFTGVPAIIVSAGPSLNQNISLLREAKGKAVIIAVGTAAKALQQHNIVPDFLVSIDSHPLNYEHFKNVVTEQIALIADMQSHHMILKTFKGPEFVAERTVVSSWLDGIVEDKGFNESGGSVANSAMVAAYKMGAAPIVFVGQDLAYAHDGHSHATGTNWENRVYTGGENLNYFYVKANDGGQVLTDRTFNQFRIFFENWIREKGDREYINATEGGAYIAGTKVMTLRDVIDQYCRKPVEVQAIIRQAQDSFSEPPVAPLTERLQLRLRDAKRAGLAAKTAIKRLNQLETACKKQQIPLMQKYLGSVRKIYKRCERDQYICPLAECFDHYDIHGVFYRTYQADYAGDDDFRAAIEDYKVYYVVLKEGAAIIRELIEVCIKEIEQNEEEKNEPV
ncbi:s-adenosyl-l-methionine-dependent methyltransferase [Lucifera butyrica]|uniref:S-adenosyl-l-methionine-dependent methyltransferase n=1 Tax=Lucifera butyrica TaxID=1351585 RepID=A0A498R8T6_9FIRM|nr:6-hydroxymethylpterin diphosphokinase MptE-like protein [Lucifera butyrica]VBB05548.1 s-adenosyl-l-methionine-dependent methyltransferase [Lucifera butyrica]